MRGTGPAPPPVSAGPESRADKKARLGRAVCDVRDGRYGAGLAAVFAVAVFAVAVFAGSAGVVSRQPS